MAGEFGVSFRVRDQFFDRRIVMAACAAAGQQVLSRAGGALRLTARRSMGRAIRSRRLKSGRWKDAPVSRPGQPPRVHQGGLKEGIWFAYSLPTKSVVVGPVRYNVDGGRVPALLEFGGQISRRFKRRANGSVIRMRGRRLRQGESSFAKNYHYEPHPYMGPALKITALKFPELWAGTLRG